MNCKIRNLLRLIFGVIFIIIFVVIIVTRCDNRKSPPSDYEIWVGAVDSNILNEIAQSTDIAELVNLLGYSTVEGLAVGSTYMGYMYCPADAAYSRLCSLKPSYNILFSYFKRSLKSHNVYSQMISII